MNLLGILKNCFFNSLSSSKEEFVPDWAIFGLGNPGKEYLNTRHNVGFQVLDHFATTEEVNWKHEKSLRCEYGQVKIGEKSVILAKPDTYMNDSGRSVSAVMRYYRIQPTNVVVVYDDITLEPTRLKVSLTGGPGGHNGIKSIQDSIGKNFIRFKIGIGGKLEKEMDLADHVLGKQGQNERESLDSNMGKYIEGLKLVVDKGLEVSMNRLNRKN